MGANNKPSSGKILFHFIPFPSPHSENFEGHLKLTQHSLRALNLTLGLASKTTEAQGHHLGVLR